jgi:hypothetical protein
MPQTHDVTRRTLLRGAALGGRLLVWSIAISVATLAGGIILRKGESR